MKLLSKILILTTCVCCFAKAGSVSAKDLKTAKKQIQVLNQQIVAASEKKDLQGAITAAEKAYKVANETFGDNDLETAKALNNLANLYVFANAPAEAEALYKKAILIYVEKIDTNGTEMADIYFNLGVAYAMQKKYSDALNILNKAINIRRSKLGADDPATQKAQQMFDELKKLAYPQSEKI